METSNNKKPSRSFLQYSSLAFQMLAPILIGVFLGKYLDEKYDGNGLYLALIALFSVVVSIYVGIKDLIQRK